MYGVWYIVIASAVIALALVLLAVVSDKKSTKWNKIYSKIPFEAKDHLRRAIFKIDFYEYLRYVCIAIIIAAAIVCILGMLFAIINPISANIEYKTFIENAKNIEYVYDSGSNYDNIAISNKVIELNTWLAQARADVELFGCMSMYYTVDLDSIDYIRLR